MRPTWPRGSQQLAEADEILLAEPTYELVRDAVDAELLPPFDLKGRGAPVTAFRLLELHPHGEAALRRLDAPMVGRQDDLARAAVDVPAGRGGTRGAGWSRCWDRPASGRAASRTSSLGALEGEATVVQGRCLPYGEGVTFWPLTEIVKQVAGIDESDSSEVAAAKLGAKLRPDCDAAVAERIAAAHRPRRGQVRRRGGLLGRADAVRDLAAERPVVAVFEDVHWAEPTLLELLEYLAKFAAGVPIVLLCLGRPELTEARPGWGEGTAQSHADRARAAQLGASRPR